MLNRCQDIGQLYDSVPPGSIIAPNPAAMAARPDQLLFGLIS
jgi:hypothetical protein